MSTDLREFETRETLISELVEFSVKTLQDALDKNGKASMAVPGGTTPAPFFEELRKVDLDWSKVAIMLTDERFVPETSDRSNTRLLKETLFQNAAAAATMVPFYAEAGKPEDVLDQIEGGIDAHLPLDLCILGMGTDMHTASLFPGADRLIEALSPTARVLLPMRADGAPEPRLTLSAPVLQGAGAVAILLMGTAKKEPLKAAMQSGDVAQAPVRAVLHGRANTTIFYAD